MLLWGVSLFLAGCVSPEEGLEQRPPLEGRTVLTAEIPPLKITRGLDAPLQSTDEHVWGEQMHLGVFDAQGTQNVKYTLFKASEGAAEGKFYGTEVKGNVYAYYPYDEEITADASKLSFPLEPVQTYNPDVLSQFKRYSRYHVAMTAENHLEFSHLYGVLGFRVKGNFNILSVRVSSENQPLAGRVAFDFENDMQAHPAAGSEYALTIDCGEGVATTEENPTIVYALLPAATYGSLTVEVVTDIEDKIVRELAGDIVVGRMSLDDLDENIAYETVEIALENVAVAKSAWEEDDKIVIYSPSRDKSQTVDLYRAAGGLDNSILAIGNATEQYSVVYPASAVQQMGQKATVLFPTEQAYSENGICAASQIYAGRCEEGKGDMYLVTSILGVNVQAPEDCSVSEIKLTSKSAALAGVFEIDMEYTDKPVAVAKQGSNTLTLVLDSPVNLQANTPKTFYFAVPAGTYAAEDLVVEVNSSLGVPFEVMTSDVTTSRAAVTDAPSITLNITDLTAGNAYANCFVLPNQKGWYSFAAKIKGGYDKDEDGNSVATATSVAGTLFELNSGMISNVKLCDNASRVSFYYDGSIGNASIATIERGDNAEYKGMVLWAWHLWCPGEGQPKDVVFGNNTYMDRNLGALYVPTSKAEMEAMSDEVNLASGGMFYSWGRPSPFPYPKSYTEEKWASRMGESANTTTPTYYYPSASLITMSSYGAQSNQSKKVCTKFTSVNEVSFSTAAAATKQPLQIGYHANSNDNRYWCKSWLYDVKSENASWNYSYEKNKQYDPCPYGYELPVTDVIVADLKSFYGANNGKAYLVEKGKCFKGGYYLEKDNVFYWHPVVGLRYSYGLWDDRDSNSANLAGATTSESANYLLWCTGTGSGARTLGTTDNTWNPATATSVRCVKK